jgi:Tfp pilus assembly protein PilE
MNEGDSGSQRIGGATRNGIAGRFRIAELISVSLVVAVFAVGASRTYQDYARIARTVEGKVLAASLWTAVQAHAGAVCGSAVVVSTMFSKVGLDSTGTNGSARWAVTQGAYNAVMADCATGAISPRGEVFAIRGLAMDVSSIGVKLTYSAAGAPSAQLLCTTDGGASFTEC